MVSSPCLTPSVKVGSQPWISRAYIYACSHLGINIFLDGFIPTENLRFREESLSFKMVETAEELIIDKTRHYSYPSMTKTLGDFI